MTCSSSYFNKSPMSKPCGSKTSAQRDVCTLRIESPLAWPPSYKSTRFALTTSAINGIIKSMLRKLFTFLYFKLALLICYSDDVIAGYAPSTDTHTHTYRQSAVTIAWAVSSWSTTALDTSIMNNFTQPLSSASINSRQ